MPSPANSAPISSPDRPHTRVRLSSGPSQKNGARQPEVKPSWKRSGQSSASSSGTIVSACSPLGHSSNSPHPSTLPGEGRQLLGCTKSRQSEMTPCFGNGQLENTFDEQSAAQPRRSRNHRLMESEGRPNSRPRIRSAAERDLSGLSRPSVIQRDRVAVKQQPVPLNGQGKPSLTCQSKARSQREEVAHGQAVRGDQPRGPSSTGLFIESPSVENVTTPNVLQRTAGREKRFIQLGIETEFHIDVRNANYSESQGPRMGVFVEELCSRYNKSVPNRHPRMHPRIKLYRELDHYERWSIIEDHSVASIRSIPYGLELVSPILKAFPGSEWREDVNAMWSYLARHYSIEGNLLCGTHIHVSMTPAFTFQEIKRIAQAAIHFEPAIEALVPPERRHNHHARSNWIDCPELGLSGKSRLESIMALETISDQEGRMALLRILNERRCCWNFLSLMSYGTIEFRKPPYSTTADECLCWAELAISFIQTCVRYKSVDQLRQVPPNVGGLRWFVSRFPEGGVNEPDRLEELWRSKGPKAMLQPVPISEYQVGKNSSEEKLLVERLLAEDTQANRRLASRAKEPYW